MKRMLRSFLLRRVLAVFILTLLSLTTSRSAIAAEPFEINVILPVTGFAAFLGSGTAATLSVIEDSVNKQGGVDGRPVKFVIHDDQSSPQVTLQLTNALVAQHVPVILGSSISAMCNAETSITKDGPVVWCLSPVINPPAGSYAFTILQTTDDYVALFLHYAQARGWHKIAVVTTTDASGQDFDNSFDRVIGKYKTEIAVSREHFAVGDLSVSAQVAHIKSADADAVFSWTTGTSLGTFLRGLKEAGLDLPVYTTPANLILKQMHAMGSAVPDNLYFPGMAAFAPGLIKTSAVKKVSLDALALLKAHDLDADSGSLSAWQPPLIVVEAFRKLGPNATAAQIREFIASYRGPGVAGQYDFVAHPQRGLDFSSTAVIRWDKSRQTWLPVSKFGGDPL